MTQTHSPFTDPKFLKSVHIVPFDADADIASLRQRECEAVYRFIERRERLERCRLRRGILFGLVFSACFYGAIWIGACL